MKILCILCHILPIVHECHHPFHAHNELLLSRKLLFVMYVLALYIVVTFPSASPRLSGPPF